MEADGVFVDTWGWMALGHRRERRHADVKRYYQDLRTGNTAVYSTE